MTNKVIVDTCVWIEYLRGRNPETVDRVTKLIHSNSIYMCGIVLYEILQGIKDPQVREKIKNDFEALPYIEMNQDAWLWAASTNKSLRSQGITIPPSDLFLASLAKNHSCTVYTIDYHFSSIPGIILYKP
ncbi:MAG: PIN domain-containing protein [Pseudomonadota bacterium]